MNINREYSEDQEGITNAYEAMDACMDAISEILIEPAMERDEIDKDQAQLLGSVALALKVIAEKAYAYEKMIDNDDILPYTNN